jgi:hypothetical protein
MQGPARDERYAESAIPSRAVDVARLADPLCSNFWKTRPLSSPKIPQPKFVKFKFWQYIGPRIGLHRNQNHLTVVVSEIRTMSP